MTASDFRHLALTLDGVEESSHMGAADFRGGPPVETEYMRELWRRIEAGRRRVAAARGEPYVPLRPRAHVPGLTLAKAIFRGRKRARQAAG